MLGEIISEGHGKRTGRRVLETAPLFKVEASFEEAVKIMGVDGMQIGTYISHPKPDGSLDGMGEGVVATATGDIITWKGVGAGTLSPDGSVSYRGAVTYNTASAKFASLNSLAGVFEFEVDAEGNTHSKNWAWK